LLDAVVRTHAFAAGFPEVGFAGGIEHQQTKVVAQTKLALGNLEVFAYGIEGAVLGRTCQQKFEHTVHE
jgi:hypothetical protein